MRPSSSNYAKLSKRRKGEPNCANGSPLSIRWPMSGTGKEDGPAIAACARISSICDGALSSTICTSWLVPSRFKLSFSLLLDFLTGALADLAVVALQNAQAYEREKRLAEE